ncbi:SAM-dependent methyltransferase [Actinomadura bangladeshensis]|uniref:SAM-dependent methyltransferase n=1 Tax=Actinomadura bangladeshensis TaxID=453573 RepID=A0A6L9QDE3_9ACTN|nr:SAM-dependent methyltransferase [Actinomadura bangladeshensis]NEA23068.1 SAM-dependent methyltransferase [Actinomadura bangladeshensis]
MDELDEDALKSHIPHSARVWNYLLGGKDHFEADRRAAEHSISVKPDMVDQARADRAFLGRAVRFLVADGIRQFLDIGTGLPTADNTHQVAQRTAPECRIVYVDHDPLVLTHARALLTSSPEGECHYIDADLCEPDKILAEARNLLDFTRPIAVMLVGILHHIEGADASHAIVRRLMADMPSGSRLVINHPTSAVHGERSELSARKWNESGGRPTVTLRSPDEIAAYFDGLEIEPPGVVSCSRWRPLPDTTEPEVDAFAAVARKP